MADTYPGVLYPAARNRIVYGIIRRFDTAKIRNEPEGMKNDGSELFVDHHSKIIDP